METDRLILRKWVESDLDDLYEYAKTPGVGPMAGWEPHESKAESYEILQMFINSKNDDWALVDKRSGKVIGSIGCRPDVSRKYSKAGNIGYVLAKPYWGKGIMPEVVNRILEYYFTETDLEIISVTHGSHNPNSKRVIEKCGFVYEGTLRKALLYRGEVKDSLLYSITKSEWQVISETR